MGINRLELITKHHPILQEIDYASPLTVGNGDFAFTADVTGLQSLYTEYEDALPLCTMSQWGWHTTPFSKERYGYTLEDVVMTEFDYQGRRVKYAKSKKPGNEAIYDWLRQNPHRLNLARISLLYKGEEIHPEDLTEIHQELKLYEGLLVSEFKLKGVLCHVETCCDYKHDTLAVKVESELCQRGALSILITFPYGSPTKSASDWMNDPSHETKLIKAKENSFKLERCLDRDYYYVTLSSDAAIDYELKGHRMTLQTQEKQFAFSIHFSKEDVEINLSTVDEIVENTRKCWEAYWKKSGVIRLNKSKDPRAVELERRVILSQYLTNINSCGSTPPQETGLTCNSWYGKMHLEMHTWHCAWAPLWNQTERLEGSFPWYMGHIQEARENAARNGYKGSRWPKMIATEGIDCPSAVAPLLIWQQPHLIYMLELCYRQNKDQSFLEKYWTLIKETAEFMVDIVVLNKETNRYDIVAPVIPVQECHRPEVTKNPAFEVEYWRYTLNLAVEWAERLQLDYDPKWEEVANCMAELPQDESHYLAHENCPDTFEIFNRDHPSMLGAYGLLPSEHVDRKKMSDTLKKVIECWQYPTLWGWDFAVMAMTATRLGDPETAVDILLVDSPKNDYVVSGNNRQKLRKDLPLYLPGNGSLLLAVAMMAAGYDGCTEEAPGFPKNGDWVVEFENISQYI